MFSFFFPLPALIRKSNPSFREVGKCWGGLREQGFDDRGRLGDQVGVYQQNDAGTTGERGLHAFFPAETKMKVLGLQAHLGSDQTNGQHSRVWLKARHSNAQNWALSQGSIKEMKPYRSQRVALKVPTSTLLYLDTVGCL